MHNIAILFFLTLLVFTPSSALADDRTPDAMPMEHQPAKASQPLEAIDPIKPEHGEVEPMTELTLENLYLVLEKYDVKHPKIVAAQALLETGRFTSQLCMEAHNLFGLRHPSDGSYYTFDTWEESVKAYRDDVQYKYSGGDYYAFLRRIGYAQDRRYTTKVKRIADSL